METTRSAACPWGAQDELLLDVPEGDLHHLHLGPRGFGEGLGLSLEPLQLGAAEVGPDGDLPLGEGQGEAKEKGQRFFFISHLQARGSVSA